MEIDAGTVIEHLAQKIAQLEVDLAIAKSQIPRPPPPAAMVPPEESNQEQEEE